jgi:hypothetical protein
VPIVAFAASAAPISTPTVTAVISTVAAITTVLTNTPTTIISSVVPIVMTVSAVIAAATRIAAGNFLEQLLQKAHWRRWVTSFWHERLHQAPRDV